MTGNIVDSVIEKRFVDNGICKVQLFINEQDFNNLYDDLNLEVAIDFVTTYLDVKGDDGRPKNIRYEIDIEDNVINIMTELQYEDNEKTDYINT